MPEVKNKLEKQIDERLQELIKDSYGRSDGGFDRARYQRLYAERMSGRLDKHENIGIQNSEYFDKDDPVFKNIMKDEPYATDAHDYSKQLNRLKNMNKGRNSELPEVRTDLRTYLGTGFTGEKTPGGAVGSPTPDDDIKKLTSVPELFVKERILSEENGEIRLVNVGDLVNHIHYKIMVEREIPEDSEKNQYSYNNIVNINKAARERLAPYVRAFLATYEMTPQMVRRVYSQKDNNLNGDGIDRPDPALRGAVTTLAQNISNNTTMLPLIAASAGNSMHSILGIGGGGNNPDKLYNIFKNNQAGGKKKSGKKKKKSKKSKKSKK